MTPSAKLSLKECFSQEGSVMTIKMKRPTQFKEFLEYLPIVADSMFARCFFNGKELCETQPTSQLNIKDGDVIDLISLYPLCTEAWRDDLEEVKEKNESKHNHQCMPYILN